jgi:exosortase K
MEIKRRVMKVEKAMVFVRRHAADIVLGTLALVLGLMLLLWYKTAGDAVWRVLLWPHAKATEVFYHTALHYQDGMGYVAAGGGFAIGPACMGINFIVMLQCLMVCAFTRRFRGVRKAAFFALALAGSAVFGVAVSCMRIIGSVPFLRMGQFTAIHTGVGIALYMIALVGSYILVNKATGGFYEKHR